MVMRHFVFTLPVRQINNLIVESKINYVETWKKGTTKWRSF